MNRLTVPGGWVEFREPEEVPEGRRREVMKLSSRGASFSEFLGEDDAFQLDKMSDDERDSAMEFMTAFNDAVAFALINAWSFEFPVSKDNLLNLPGVVYDAIVKHCSPLAKRLMPSFGADGAMDPKAHTEHFSE